MYKASDPVYCGYCKIQMNRDFRAEGVLVGAGKRSYHKPIVSSSMAINPCQAEEHKRMFPDIKLAEDCMPVFDNFSDHEKYMKKCNIVKEPQRRKKKGKRIA